MFKKCFSAYFCCFQMLLILWYTLLSSMRNSVSNSSCVGFGFPEFILPTSSNKEFLFFLRSRTFWSYCRRMYKTTYFPRQYITKQRRTNTISIYFWINILNLQIDQIPHKHMAKFIQHELWFFFTTNYI